MALYTHTSPVALVLRMYTIIALTYTCRAVIDGELHRALREKFLGLYNNYIVILLAEYY